MKIPCFKPFFLLAAIIIALANISPASAGSSKKVWCHSSAGGGACLAHFKFWFKNHLSANTVLSTLDIYNHTLELDTNREELRHAKGDVTDDGIGASGLDKPEFKLTTVQLPSKAVHLWVTESRSPSYPSKSHM